MAETLDRLRSALARRYDIERELGRGGMATVYVAFDKRHDRQVAIKVFPPALAAAIGPERFQREIAITSRLSHPNILPLFDSGQAAGALYYVMPLVKGESLRDRLDRNPDGLPLNDVVSLAEQIGSALDHAHSIGVIHRDVTPDNILLSNSHALLADFGIARLVEGETLTESGIPLGTAMYRSPEQASGHTKVGPASDIYSLACVLYECVGGNAARKFLSNRFASPVPSVRKLRPSAPSGLEAAVSRAMNTDADARFASAGKFVRALSRPPSLRHRWHQMRWAALVVVAIGLSAAGFSIFRTRETNLVRSRVLVGSFVNRSGDKSLDALSDMAGDYIARGLAETSMLEVIDSRAENPGESRAIAASLGAATIVQGRIYRTADRIHFETQVVDTRTGKLVTPTQPAEGNLTDGTALIETLRQHLMGSFAALYGPRFEAWRGASLPPSYDAYKEILAGDEAESKFDYGSAMDHYRRASAMDTSYDGARTMAALTAGLEGDCRLLDSISSVMHKRLDQLSVVDRGRLEWAAGSCHGDWNASLIAGRKVLAAIPQSGLFSILLAVAAMENFRPHEAIDVLRKLSPDEKRLTSRQIDMRSGFMSLAYHQLGDNRAEIREVRNGLRHSPADPQIKTDELTALAASGRMSEMWKLRSELLDGKLSYDRQLWNPAQVDLCVAMEARAHGHPEEANRLVLKSAEWFSTNRASSSALPGDVFCVFRLLVPTYYAGQLSEAANFYRRVLARDSLDFQAHEGLGAIAAGKRDTAEMQRMDAWLASHSHYEHGRASYSRARMAAVAGDLPRAMRLLEQAMKEGLGYRMLLHVDPDLEPLHALPSYRAMLALKD